MPAEERIYDDFGKGINTFTRDTMIKENEAANAYNVWSVGKNSIRKRPGIVKLCEVVGTSKIDGIGTYYNGSTRELLVMANGTLYKVNSGIAVAISGKTYTSGLRTDFCQAGGKVFIQNGTDALSEYNGTSISDTTNGVIGKYLIYYKSCLWTWGNTGAGNLTRLYRSGSDSKIGDFTYNVSTNPLATSVYVSKDDGQALIGGYKHQDYFYAVKERSLWRVSMAADSAGTIAIELVDPARGADSHFTIDAVENDNFMFSELGVFATGYEPNIDQVRTNIVSLRIDNKLKTIEKSNLDATCGIFFDNHYYLAYASGGSTSNDTVMVYDRQRLGWWEWFINANCFSEYKNSDGETKLYFGSSTDGSIYYFDETAKSDDSLTIPTNWESSKLSMKNISQMKFFLTVLLYFGKAPGDVTYSVYVDGVLAKTDPSVMIGSSGSAGMGVGTLGVEILGVGDGSLDVSDNGGADLVKIPINKLGRNIQVQIEDNNGNKTWELNGLIVHYKPLSKQFQPGTRN